ncbi:hypothetical protein ABTE72_19880, partial [Acinetobacter baumannii]
AADGAPYIERSFQMAIDNGNLAYIARIGMTTVAHAWWWDEPGAALLKRCTRVSAEVARTRDEATKRCVELNRILV